MLLGFPDLTIIVLKSPSKKLRKGVRKLMAELWINSRSAPPIWFSVSPHFIRAFPVDRHRPNQYFNQTYEMSRGYTLNSKWAFTSTSILLAVFTFKQGEMGHWHTAIDYYWMRYYGLLGYYAALLFDAYHRLFQAQIHSQSQSWTDPEAHGCSSVWAPFCPVFHTGILLFWHLKLQIITITIQCKPVLHIRTRSMPHKTPKLFDCFIHMKFLV